MTISRVELQGQITRAQDFTNLKHNEDNRSMVEQSQIMGRTAQAAEVKLQHVNDTEHTENRQKKFDAKEKGSNGYAGDGGQGRRKKNGEDGRIVAKGAQQGGFDLKI